MIRRFFSFNILVFISIAVYPQGELADDPELFYKDEKSYAILLNTSGLGFNFTYGKRINAYKKTLYQFDIAEIKHPKEVKLSLVSPSFESSGSFVYGKLNKFFTIRSGLGVQKELYRKVDKDGVSIRRYLSGGLNIGLEKPMYYIVLEYQNPSLPVRVERKFNTEPHASNNIERNASFFKGFDEIKVVPGIFVKYAYMFEYSKYERTLHALEGGAIVDAFPRPVKLMAHNNNDFIFVSLFLSYRFGKVIDSKAKGKKDRIDEMLGQ
jgi:hypothetical protein